MVDRFNPHEIATQVQEHNEAFKLPTRSLDLDREYEEIAREKEHARSTAAELWQSKLKIIGIRDEQFLSPVEKKIIANLDARIEKLKNEHHLRTDEITKEHTASVTKLMELYYDLVDNEWNQTKVDALNSLVNENPALKVELEKYLTNLIFSVDIDADWQQVRIPGILKLITEVLGQSEVERYTEYLRKNSKKFTSSSVSVESESSEGSYDLTTVIKSKDVEAIYALLQKINVFLTGGTTSGGAIKMVKGEIAHYLKDLDKEYGGELKFYLADGGYSRFFINSDAGYDDLKYSIGENNASAAVREKWSQLKSQIK